MEEEEGEEERGDGRVRKRGAKEACGRAERQDPRHFLEFCTRDGDLLKE